MVAATLVVCTACVSTANTGAGDKSPAITKSSVGSYGDEYVVQATVGAVKLQGNLGHVSSRAIRLPERPLGEIAVFGYQFPPACGGHAFRVYEARDMQILEYQYAAHDGATHVIRDYVSGPNPFVEPGLWTAYDHTAGSISSMTSQFEQRSGGSMNGVYSQGLVTGLPVSEQRVLGNAYQQALSDVYACRDAQAVADVSVD